MKAEENNTPLLAVLGKLCEIQYRMHCPKDNDVKDYNGRKQYSYRNLAQIAERGKDLLHELKCAIVIDNELVLMGEGIAPVFEEDAKGVKHMIAGPHYYIKSTATLYDCESGGSISATDWAREAEYRKGLDPSQQTGSTSSYAGKYACEHLYALDTQKDADQLAAEQAKAKDETCDF